MASWNLNRREWLAIMVMAAILAGIALPVFGRAQEAARRASCQNNLKQWGLIMKMYASESRGERWPVLSRTPHNWLPDIETLYPDYLVDPSILISPDSPWAHLDEFTLKRSFDLRGVPGDFHPACAWHASYVYTGLTIQDDEQALAVYGAAMSMPWAEFRDTDLALDVPVWEGSSYGAGGQRRTGISVIWTRLPVVEHEFGYRTPVANVLAMDGSVHAVRYHPDNASHNFPVTRISAMTFGAAAPRRPSDCLW